jgi:hypothetical protein
VLIAIAATSSNIVQLCFFHLLCRIKNLFHQSVRFFGVALYISFKTIKKDEVRDYVLLSSLGIILLFASNQPIALTLMSFPFKELCMVFQSSLDFSPLFCFFVLAFCIGYGSLYFTFSNTPSSGR